MRDTAALYRALGDETRLQMLWLLMNHRELCVCDFIEVLGVTQSKASRHLRSLFHAGLVDDRRQGLWVYYSLREGDEPHVRSALQGLESHLLDRPLARELLGSLSRWLVQAEQGGRCAT